MKITLPVILAMACLTVPTIGKEFQFEIPGSFLVSPHGTLYVSAPDGWDVATVYSESDATTNTPPPRFPGPQINAKNSTGAEINIIPMNIEERSVLAFVNDRLGKDTNGSPLPRTPITGPYAKGSVCFQTPGNYSRSHGDLETGNLLLSFAATLANTNEWQDVQNILESFRFDEKESVEQSGAAYPPQGVGSADP